MKILMIGNIKELSGWSLQLHNHALALDLAGVDVAVRNINILNNENPDLHVRVRELLKKDISRPDVIVQNVLPHMLEYTSKAKCVAYCVTETSNFRNTNWTSRLNLMDNIFVPCYSNKVACLDSGVIKPIDVVPECIDTDRYSRDYPIHPIRNNLKDKFIFLCIAEWTVRKNIEAIVKAFHTEFAVSEPVELVIKTTPVGMSNPQNEINERLENIKRGLKLYNSTDRYKRENVICGFLSEQDLSSLYKSCDAFVNASRAEAFCIPVMDALGFGLPVVSSAHSGLDYLTDKNAFIVDHYEQPCFNALDTLADLYSGREYWWEARQQSLQAQMRAAYEKRTLALKRVQAGRETIKDYSLERVGQIYKKELEKIL